MIYYRPPDHLFLSRPRLLDLIVALNLGQLWIDLLEKKNFDRRVAHIANFDCLEHKTGVLLLLLELFNIKNLECFLDGPWDEVAFNIG